MADIFIPYIYNGVLSPSDGKICLYSDSKISYCLYIIQSKIY